MRGDTQPGPAARFTGAIVAGDAVAAEEAARRLLSDGTTLLAVYELMTDALDHVGQCWETGRMSVADEHRATAAAGRLVARLRGAPPHAVRGSVVLTTLPGERHTLGLQVLEHLFEVARFRAVALGDLPVDDVADLLAATPSVRAVLISAHVTADPDELRAAVLTTRAAAPEAHVIVGGPAFATQRSAHNRYGAHAVRLTARDALAAVDEAARPLSRRETEVLELLSNGMTNNQIAAALEVSGSTVKGYVDAVIAKLGATSRTGAVAAAFRAGLLG